VSNTAAMTCLDLPSMHFRILVSKLGFLVRLLKKDDDNLAGSVVLSLCDFGESCLVRECRLWDLASELGFEGCVWSANAQQSNGSLIYALSTTVSSTPVSSTACHFVNVFTSICSNKSYPTQIYCRSCKTFLRERAHFTVGKESFCFAPSS